jgi:glycosyltransferase involved in cell wall biosynthesis
VDRRLTPANRTVYVNEAFRPQRVSGQQRYAREVGDRLPEHFVRLRPDKFWAKSKLRTWLWVQTVLPIRSVGGVLISMTARAPLWHPRQLLVVHDLFVIDHPEWFSRKYHLTHAPLQRFQMRTAKALAAVSEPVADEVRPASDAHGIPVVVAPNAASDVFTSSGDLGDVDVLDRLGLRVDSFLITVGNIEPRKNLARLAAAYGTLPDPVRMRVPLVVVGGSADVFKDASLDWPAGTVIAGFVSDAELRALYAQSRAVVFPSLAEGFGLPLVEAAAAGTKHLLVSDIPVFRWICGAGARYFDPRSPIALAEALHEITGEEHDVPAVELDPARFSWDRSAATVADVAARIAVR